MPCGAQLDPRGAGSPRGDPGPGRVVPGPVAGSEGGDDQVVRAADGVGLHAEITGDPAAPLTLVFCHGFGGDRDTWTLQRAALAARVRVVAWDQRGHGRSGWGDPARATIAQTGGDLDHTEPTATRARAGLERAAGASFPMAP